MHFLDRKSAFTNSNFTAVCCRWSNGLVSQMRAPLAACREPRGKLWHLCKVLYDFEHKTQYLLIHAPYTRIVRRVKFVSIPPHSVQQHYLWNIALQPAVGCYNLWANIRCSGCSPLGEISLWNVTIALLMTQTQCKLRYCMFIHTVISPITSI